MGKAIAREHPEFTCTCLDLESAADLDLLWSEITQPSWAQQVAWRQGQRYLPLLQQFKRQPRRLVLPNQGTIKDLTWQPHPRQEPGKGEVEVKIRATGLNFRDILGILGVNLGLSAPLGLECAGEVVKVGPGVEHLQIGERVFGLAVGSLGDYVTVSALWLVRQSPALSFEQAATIPGAFLTAYYTLIQLAQLQPGERVLIHAAAGGVGLAAVQIAQAVGAEIFATASPEKWEFLKSLGVKWVMNSRNLEFAQQIAALTGGQGVNVVLNCLLAKISLFSAKEVVFWK
jgi:myxalamid-type polyketide synthase MxaB